MLIRGYRVEIVCGDIFSIYRDILIISEAELV